MTIHYRLFMPAADSFSYVECSSEASARIERNAVWAGGHVGPVHIQFKNDRFPQDGWRDVPYYQEHHLS